MHCNDTRSGECTTPLMLSARTADRSPAVHEALHVDVHDKFEGEVGIRNLSDRAVGRTGPGTGLLRVAALVGVFEL